MSTTITPIDIHQSASRPDAAEMALLERRAKRFWVGLIVCFLGVQVLIGGVSIYLAVGDPSVAVIPNYHQSALDWDIKHRAQQLLEQLAWNVDVTVSPLPSNERLLQVQIQRNRTTAVDGLKVSAKVYHHARGEEIFKFSLPEQTPGIYQNSLALNRPGLWQVELTIEGDHGIASKTIDIEVD